MHHSTFEAGSNVTSFLEDLFLFFLFYPCSLHQVLSFPAPFPSLKDFLHHVLFFTIDNQSKFSPKRKKKKNKDGTERKGKDLQGEVCNKKKISTTEKEKEKSSSEHVVNLSNLQPPLLSHGTCTATGAGEARRLSPARALSLTPGCPPSSHGAPWARSTATASASC